MSLTFIAVRQENPTKSNTCTGGLKNHILNCSTKRILYIPNDPTEIRHIDEVLKLLQVMTGDERYLTIFQEKKGVRNMCDVAERLEKMGIEKGLKQGIGEGIKQGIEQGIEIGKTAGIHAEKIRVYKRLIEKGFSEKEAREIAELPETLNG